MFFVYNIQNTNPALGPIKGDSQAVSVYDRDLGNRRTVITSPEEAEEFVTARKHYVNSAAKQGLGIGAAMTAIGAAAGAVINHEIEKSKAIKLNKLVDQINGEYKQALKNSKKGNTFILEDVLKSDVYKNVKFKLRELFSYDENIFKNVDLKALSKTSLKVGALIGAGIGAFFGLFAPDFKAEKADKKITQAFIENNK